MNTNVIHCGECAEVMAREIPDESIDLTVTSPPYDNLRDYHGYTFDFEAIAAQLWRVTKTGGVVVWVVADQTKNGSESGTSFRQALGFMELGFDLHDTMIYQKNGGGANGSNYCYLQMFDYMFILSKDRPASLNLIRDRKNRYGKNRKWYEKRGRRKKNGDKKEGYEYRKSKDFGRRSNVWLYTVGGAHLTKDREGDLHPAIFPEALARDHIISWSSLGDVVLDPMCGSGTTLKMAKELDRQYIGIDISREYCDLSDRRVRAARVALPGFNEAVQDADKHEQAALL